MALSLNQSTAVDLGALGIADYPFTMVGWFRVPSASSLLTLMRINNTVTTSYHGIMYEGHLSGQVLAASKVGVAAGARTTIPMTPGQWHHVAAVFAAENSRRVYLDGGNMGSSGHVRVFDGADQYRMGNLGSSDAVDVAEAAIFAAVLTDQEIGMLARGCPVWSLPRASDLLTCHDCLRGINRPGVGPLASVASAPAVVSHPRVLLAHGGRILAQPFRKWGPFQVSQGALRTSFTEQGQLSAAGVAENAGQTSVAGIAANSSVSFGEVLC